MKRLALILAATALASTPALAQHSGHNMPGMTMPMPAKPAAKKPAAKKPVAKKAAPKKAAAKKAATKKVAAKKPAAKKATAQPKPAPADPHAGHDMSMPGMAMPESDQPAGHDMSGTQASPPASDPHSGHDMSMPGMAMPETAPTAGHDMGAMAQSDIPPGPPPPGALAGPAHAADGVWGAGSMAGARRELVVVHGATPFAKIAIDRAEARFGKGRDGWLVEGEAWFGGDIDKAVVKIEGEGAFGRRADHASGQLLWSHAIGRYFDLQAGLRADVEPRTRGRLVIGVEGLAPYWIHVDAAAFLSTRGDLTARLEAWHDVRITQKLVLQPRFEADLSAQNVPDEGVGRGLSSVSAGLRLGYKIEPNFIPYVGIDYGRAFGRTADYRRTEGEKASELRAVAGIRAFF